MNEPKISLDPVESAPTTKKGKRKKKGASVPPSSRQLPYHRKWFQRGYTLLFYSVIAAIILVLLLTLGRYDRLTTLANQKAIDPADFARQVQTEAQVGDTVAFDGQKWLTVLYTSPTSENEKKQREKRLSQGMSTTLDHRVMDYGMTDKKRVVQAISIVKQTTTHPKGRPVLYRTVYQVTFTEQGKKKEEEVRLSLTHEGGQTQVVLFPEVMNETKTNPRPPTSSYKAEDFYVDGKELDEEAQRRVQKFVEQYFTLYCRNDANLGLISAVQGLDGATFASASLDHVVWQKNTIVVQGTYTYTYTKGLPNTTAFTMRMKQNKDSYYVTQMNPS